MFFTRCDIFCNLHFLQYTHTEKCYLQYIRVLVLYNKNSTSLLKVLGGQKRKTSLLTRSAVDLTPSGICVYPLIPHRSHVLRRICELDDVFEERLGELRRYLLKRGFRTEVVDGQLQKARDVSRTALLDQGYNKKDKFRVPSLLDFHPALSGIGKKIRVLFPILHASVDMKRIFVEVPLVSFRRP